MHKTLTGGAIAITLAAASLFIAAPASAASAVELPSGDELWGISCDGEEMLGLTISTTDAVGTVVGTGSSTIDSDCGGPGAVDPTTGTAYFISWGQETELAIFDPATGDSTAVGTFFDGDVDVDADSMAIGIDGAAYLIDDNRLYSLKLSDATVTFIANIPDVERGFFGFAADPTTGIIYAVSVDGAVYTVSAAGVFTPAGTITLPDSETDIWALQIDSNGTWWIENDGVNADIWSLTPAGFAGGATLSGVVTVGGEELYLESLLILPTADVVPTEVVNPAPAPVLANTGGDTTQGLIAGGAALLLLAAGAALALIGKRRTA